MFASELLRCQGWSLQSWHTFMYTSITNPILSIVWAHQNLLHGMKGTGSRVPPRFLKHYSMNTDTFLGEYSIMDFCWSSFKVGHCSDYSYTMREIWHLLNSSKATKELNEVAVLFKKWRCLLISIVPIPNNYSLHYKWLPLFHCSSCKSCSVCF